MSVGYAITSVAVMASCTDIGGGVSVFWDHHIGVNKPVCDVLRIMVFCRGAVCIGLGTDSNGLGGKS